MSSSPSNSVQDSGLRPLRVPLTLDTPASLSATAVRNNLTKNHLKTVCEEASCPNLNHCWKSGTATFLILGNKCTRACTFCDIETARPLPPDPMESDNVARAVLELRLSHAVITSVTRDDLPDGGASQYVETVRAIRALQSPPTIELLVPDFKGDFSALDRILDMGVDVLNHNIETIPEFYQRIRPGADYKKSLDLLNFAYSSGKTIVKSGIMLGFGETPDQVLSVFRDLKNSGVEILTIGQYLPPSQRHAPLVEQISMERFDLLATAAEEIGFSHVESGPLVRSSFHAATGAQKTIEKIKKNGL